MELFIFQNRNNYFRLVLIVIYPIKLRATGQQPSAIFPIETDYIVSNTATSIPRDTRQTIMRLRKYIYNI